MSSSFIQAQQSDTIWVVHQDKHNYIKHIVSRGETVMMLAARFNAPVATTAQANQMSYSEGLSEGQTFKIPVGTFNYLRINSVVNSRPIYYRVQEGERLRTISRYFNLSQNVIQHWNDLPLPEVFSGQALKIGWIKFDKTQTPFAAETPQDKEEKKGIAGQIQSAATSGKELISRIVTGAKEDNDTDKVDLGKQFHEQNAGKELEEASGAAVFFDTQTPDESDIIYALCDQVPRGTLLSIFNPSSRKAVYAKVIGPLPKISKYHNALVGLSANAAKELQAKGAKIFVKIKY